jgi:hypothetical protein
MDGFNFTPTNRSVLFIADAVRFVEERLLGLKQNTSLRAKATVCQPLRHGIPATNRADTRRSEGQGRGSDEDCSRNGYYDLVVVDVFDRDSVPAALCSDLFVSRLAALLQPGGVVVMVHTYVTEQP